MSASRDAAVREAYARDASGLTMLPDAVARPQSSDEVLALLAEARATRTPITTAGGQTSTTGASICDRGVVMSTRALTRIRDLDLRARTVRVQPGVILGDLQRTLAADGLQFAPDPTSEHECTVGGAIACNASGPRTLRYGATRAHVQALTVALADGRIIDVARPALEKNTVGYAPAQDLVDWFVGSEGTLGIILEAELRLLPRPERETGIAFPFAGEREALGFIVAAREAATLRPRCLEFFDRSAAQLARGDGGERAGAWPADVGAVVYIEDAGDGDAPLDAWLTLAEAHAARTDDAVVFDGDAAIAAARRLRHAVPAGMHERAAPYRALGGRRLSTDWAVPYRRLADAIALAREHARAAGVDDPVVFGHAGNGHPHCNFVGCTPEDVHRIEAVIEATLHDVLRMGGTVAAEHGIGKLKRRWLPLQCSPLQQDLMRAMKRALDPDGLLAPGNVL